VRPFYFFRLINNRVGDKRLTGLFLKREQIDTIESISYKKGEQIAKLYDGTNRTHLV
jgi:hypothetical protein